MSMVTIKTADLIGPALDWATAVAIGQPVYVVEGMPVDGHTCLICYSADWSQGGPLIDKFMITGGTDSGDDRLIYWAYAGVARDGFPCLEGESFLIAACRAIVAAKLGDEVQVPAELVQQ